MDHRGHPGQTVTPAPPPSPPVRRGPYTISIARPRAHG
nr:MAG TPA: hypothetical protein [Caudoviricetes sp.]